MKMYTLHPTKQAVFFTNSFSTLPVCLILRVCGVFYLDFTQVLYKYSVHCMLFFTSAGWVAG